MHVPVPRSDISIAARRRRRGCFGGCLGCLTKCFVVLFAGVILVMIVQAALGPYAYFYGGHFHLYGGWQGQGWIHDPAAGGDYFLWLRIDPTTPAYRKSDLHGSAFLCTPRGERFRMTLIGDLPRQKPVNTIGVPLRISMHHRPLLFWNFVQYDPHPSLSFTGTFGDRKLLLEDHGSLLTSFKPDGTLYAQHDPHRPWPKRTLDFTLYESTPWTMGPPCPAAPPK